MTLFAPEASWAEQLRPRRLSEVVGHEELLGKNGLLQQMLSGGHLPSLLLAGPPGCGKTTLARLLAEEAKMRLVELSATSAGLRELRAAEEEAMSQGRSGRKTALFIDEIHRFSRTQQDALLPSVERGTFVLIGATTEPPAAACNAALLSRVLVLRLSPLSDEALQTVLQRAAARFLRAELSVETLQVLTELSGADLRRALGLLENASRAEVLPSAETVRRLAMVGGVQGSVPSESHLISALQKSIRASHPDAALYWLAACLHSGVDRRRVGRRLLRMASEEVGLAEVGAVTVVLSLTQAADALGHPEGDLALAQAAEYLALLPKSNAIYSAWNAVSAHVAEHGPAPVPAHLHATSPTYIYSFDGPEAPFAQAYLPVAATWARYQPSEMGWEHRVRERWAALRERHAPQEP